MTKLNQTATKQSLIQTVNSLIDAVQRLEPRGTCGIKVQPSSGGTCYSLLNPNTSGGGSGRNRIALPYDEEHPFKVSYYKDGELNMIKIKGGIVNNQITIPDYNSSYVQSNVYPAVSMGFSAQTDGTVLLTSQNITTQYDINASPITINGNSVQMFVFLGAIKTLSGGGGKEVEQYISGNFFGLPLAKQKQVWLV